MTEPDILTAPAISLWEPWATLWLIEEAKVHETRHWPMPARYVGKRALVHAAKKRVPLDSLDEALIEVCRQCIGSDWRTSVPYGAFAGSITLADSRPMGVSRDLAPAFPAHPNDEVCGHWSEERYAWRGANPRIFATPVPAVGHQGFWLAGVPRSLLVTEPVAAARKPLRLHTPTDAADAPEPVRAAALARDEAENEEVIPTWMKRLAGGVG